MSLKGALASRCGDCEPGAATQIQTRKAHAFDTEAGSKMECRFAICSKKSGGIFLFLDFGGGIRCFHR